jgi:hypothetical protein
MSGRLLAVRRSQTGHARHKPRAGRNREYRRSHDPGGLSRRHRPVRHAATSVGFRHSDRGPSQRRPTFEVTTGKDNPACGQAARKPIMTPGFRDKPADRVHFWHRLTANNLTGFVRENPCDRLYQPCVIVVSSLCHRCVICPTRLPLEGHSVVKTVNRIRW